MPDILARLGFSEAETADLVARARRAYRDGKTVTLPTKERLGPPLARAEKAAGKLVEALDALPAELRRAFDNADLPSGYSTRDLVTVQDRTLVLRTLAAALSGFEVTLRVADSPGRPPPRQRDFGTNRFILIAANAFKAKTGRHPAVTVDPYTQGHPESGDFVGYLEALAVAADVPVRGLVNKFKHLRSRGSV